jgi:CPA1 family monovalent cation:H+ antiporter
VPRKIITILDGESLVNDATSFTTYRFAVAATVTGAFSLAEASVRFVIAVAGGIIVGLVMGWIVSSIQRRLDDPPVQTTLSLLTPYITYLAAERMQTSGVLAVVITGLYVGWRAPEIFTSRMRLVAFAVWGMVVFILNGFIFILIGLQLPEVVHGLSRHSLAGSIWLALLVVGLLIVVRFLWFMAAIYVPRLMNRMTHRDPSMKHILLMSWAGMRGVDSLAAALALPLVIQNGDPFPYRALIVFLTFSVILGTLVLQGLSLKPIIRWLKIDEDSSQEDEERQARLKANQAGLVKLAEIAKLRHVDENLIGRLRAEYEDRIQQLAAPEHGPGPAKLSLFSPEYEELLREILGEERKTILRLRNERAINDHVLRRIQRDIDLAEVRLQQGKAE